MPHAINYRVSELSDDSEACEIHINGQLAIILRKLDDGFEVHPAADFSDASVTADDLQSAIEGAAAKLADNA